MDSSHTINLQRILDKIIKWNEECDGLWWRTSASQSQEKKGKRKASCRISVPFSGSDLVVIRDTASILDIHRFMVTKRSYLSDSDCYANFHLSKAWRLRFKTHNFIRINKWMATFLEDLNEVFVVPKLNHPKNVQVVSFMEFLLQLLIGKPHLFASKADLVITELRSFVTIFIDSPFQATENDGQVQTILSQFETLANEAGRLVYSYLFSLYPRPSKKIDELLLEPITLLKANLIQFFNSHSYMNTTNTLHFAMSFVFIVDSFLCDLENLMNREDNSIAEVKDHVEKLYQSFKHSWSLLNKHSDQTNEVKEVVLLASDAEYLINYFLCGDAPAWYLAIRLPYISHNVELVGIRIQEMERKHHGVDPVLKVGENFGARLSLQTGINSGMFDSMVEVKDKELKILDPVVGFEDEQLKLLGKLVGGGEGMQIISIIGMPGLGKTTLGKRMHNHPLVKEKFHRISWCTVSQVYTKKKLLSEILMGLDSKVDKATIAKEGEDDVGVRIHKTLMGRKYFIVLDDIWESSAWEDIKRYFPNDRNGSRILFTSRNKEVADQCNSSIHELPLLSNNQCWELLKKKVFHDESCPPELQHIGERIAMKCNGLPLVAVVVAGILLTMKKDISAWENLRIALDSYILSYQDRAVERSLELSYMYLPQHLKPCFLYFGRFQEDEQIHVKKVMQLWIAEGFIHAEKNKRAEDSARKYLNELIDKNLVVVAQKNYNGQAKVCTMHDLLRDLCLKVADGESSFGDQNVHRMICQSSSSHGWLRPYLKYMVSFRRTKGCLSPNVCHMKALRVLDAIDCGMPGKDVLVGIQNLVHLRYLSVFAMPKPLCRFSSLEYLIVGLCVRLSSSLLDAMTKLRYLEAHEVYVDIDCNTSSTHNLEYISKVMFCGQEDEQRLKAFPSIRNFACGYEYSNSELCHFDFSSFTQLESLTLCNSPKMFEIRSLPENIIKLCLSGCDIQSWQHMSTIGALPNLEVLKLHYVKAFGIRWETRDDEFTKLKYLKLTSIKDLCQWKISSCEPFPVLQQLIIRECPYLSEIPIEIGDISTLQLISVRWCGRNLRKSITKIEEQLKGDGNEDVRIVVEVYHDEHEDEEEEQDDENPHKFTKNSEKHHQSQRTGKPYQCWRWKQ